MRGTFAILAALVPSPILALVGIDWSVTNVPSTGLTDITFPITIAEADHISGYYFAQQFNFVGTPDVGYTGLQPRPNKRGKPVIHAVFSSFIAGTSTKDPNCSPGADGGPGVSCSFEWNGIYGRTYNMEVKTTGGRTWVGTAVDTVTGARIHVGSFTLPKGTNGIKSKQGGFIEWYPWNASKPPNHCARLPYCKVIFGNPRTTHTGSVGKQSLAYEYGDCVGKVAFSTARVARGVRANVGFRGQTGH
jgi:hypothetical protein|nr:hypothetical protein [Epichloe festucae]